MADAVIALDDGSTDDTRRVLLASPHVSLLLTNPARPGYAGWDDAANRARLLAAAATLSPEWVLWLDADERIPADDAAALRAFIATDAVANCAYGFRHFRMWGDECDPRFAWIYRLFGYRADQTLPTRRLHFNPIPTDIPRPRWVCTTVRFQHVGVSDEARLRAHVDKYRQADPAAEYGTNFGGLAEPPAELEPWLPRAAGLPVLLASADIADPLPISP